MYKTLQFYHVDKNYIEYLRQAELSKRGYTKIPNYNYESHEKFVCGIVLNINHLNYYVPISSFTTPQKSNIVIKDGDVPIASLRFCFMFPVPNSLIERKDFRKEDITYKRLLMKELAFCQANQEWIVRKAKQIYQKVINGYSSVLCKSSCDFKLLEQKCMEYIKRIPEIDEIAAYTKQSSTVKNISFFNNRI